MSGWLHINSLRNTEMIFCASRENVTEKWNSDYLGCNRGYWPLSGHAIYISNREEATISLAWSIKYLSRSWLLKVPEESWLLKKPVHLAEKCKCLSIVSVAIMTLATFHYFTRLLKPRNGGWRQKHRRLPRQTAACRVYRTWRKPATGSAVFCIQYLTLKWLLAETAAKMKLFLRLKYSAETLEKLTSPAEKKRYSSSILVWKWCSLYVSDDWNERKIPLWLCLRL